MLRSIEHGLEREPPARVETDPRVVRRTTPRIFVIEDDPALRALISIELRSVGFDVVTAADGGEFVAAIEGPGKEYGIRREEISVIVSDIRMPGVDGLTLLAQLRSAEWETPVVLMTAFGSFETSTRAAELGAVMLDKPFLLDELAAVVARMVQR